MPSKPYLIAHKVRGEAAFDVAERVECPECQDGCPECDGLGYWWIVSTSGHRAHPYASWKLEDLVDASDYPHTAPWTFDDKMPEGLPDHYPLNASPKAPARDIVAMLGLAPKPRVIEGLKRL